MDSSATGIPANHSNISDLGWCPCKSYIRLLFGKHGSNSDSSSNVKLRGIRAIYHDLFWMIRFFLPVMLCIVFTVDFGDWLMHDENLTGFSSRHVRGEQSYIITVFAFLRSQFTCFVGLNSTFVFIRRAPQFVRCIDALVELKKLLHGKSAKAGVPLRLKFSCVALGYLCIASLLRLVYYLYATFYIDIGAFWDPTKYFYFTLPQGLIMLFIQVSVIISEISLLPLYFFFVAVCTVYTRCSKVFNDLLKETIHTKIMNYSVKGDTFDFDTIFQDLMKKEMFLIDVLRQMDSAFSIFLASLLLGNSSILASIIAQGFMRAVFATPLDTAMFLGSLSNPITSLLTIIIFATILHETSLESKILWTSFVANRQFHREKKIDPEEGEKLITILHITESRPYSLSVIRTVNMERGFGITLVMGFFGFVCFLIERSENFRAQVDLVMGAINATIQQ